MTPKLKLGIILFILGMIGVLSMLTIQLPADAIPPEVTARFSPSAIRLLILLNPMILLLISVITGTLLHEKAGLKVPTISGLLQIEKPEISFREQLKSGIIAGLSAGVLITLLALAGRAIIPDEFNELSQSMKITAFARFAYGGITEEILLRFGVMTFIVWAIFRIRGRLTNSNYISGILIAALLFAIGHFPAVYQSVASPSSILLMYILTGNLIAGIAFGWLYWKKGLEAAFVGHIFAHVAMMIGENLSGM